MRVKTSRRPQINSPAQQSFVPMGFIRKILYRRLDSSGLLEVHADGGLGDLQVGQTAEVLRDRREEERSTPGVNVKTARFKRGHFV